MRLALAERDERAFDVVRPRSGDVARGVEHGERLWRWKGRGDEFHLAVRARGDGHERGAINRHREDEPLIVVGVIAEQLNAARGLDGVDRRKAEVLAEELLDFEHWGVVRKT